MKKVLSLAAISLMIIIAIVIFSSNTLENQYPPENEEITSIRASILQKQQILANNRENTALQRDLAETYYALDVAIAKAEGVTQGNNPQFTINQNTNTCTLLIHGFAASPFEMQTLNDYLIQKNLSVYNVRVSGHGINNEDFKKATNEDWINSIDIPMKASQSICKNIVIAGISFGGNIALSAAQNYDLSGIITISTPIYFHDKRIMYAKYFKHIIKNTERNLTQQEIPHYYINIPSEQVAQMASTIKKVKKELTEITTPTLVIQTKEDKRVIPKSANYIIDNIASTNKNLIMYDTGEHVLTRDPMNQTLAEDVYGFIQSLS